MFRNILLATALIGALAAPAVAATNLVANGSFESGLTGWTIGGTETQGFPPAAIFYNSATAYPTGAFGEAVPPANAVTFSPDPAGERGAYFVSDFANAQSLTQTVFLAAGTYTIGFSVYAPANGFANLNDAQFSATIANVELASYAVSTGPATTWQAFSGAATIVTAGNYQIEFLFDTNGNPAKDVVIDQVYIIAGNPGGGDPDVIPTPAALGLFGLGLLGLAAARRRRA
jgi:MYXO-CTERM domain-containing protein